MISPNYSGDTNFPKMRLHEVILWCDNPDIENQIQMCKDYCYHWAYILHDSDVDEDGFIKKPHYHFIMYFQNERLYSRVKFFVESFSNEHNLFSGDILSKRVRYLVHADHPKKFQYNINDIHSNFDISRFFTSCINLDDIYSDILSRICTGDIYSIRTLLDYGVHNNCSASIRRDFRIFQSLIHEMYLPKR